MPLASLTQFNPGQEPGTGCFALDLPCRVRFGGADVNLTSFILVSYCQLR
jgi:hypothetical protein